VLLVGLDGTDIYTVRERKEKVANHTEWVRHLVRESFRNSTRVRLLKVLGDERSDDDADYIHGVWAGGGHVAIQIQSYAGPGPATTRIERISRDGASKQVIATSATPEGVNGEYEYENGKAVRSDCGRRVDALSMNGQGAVVIAEIAAERASKVCGGKANVDHWRVYELSLSGLSREIFTMDRLLSGDSNTGNGSKDVQYPGAVEAVGDRAIYQTSIIAPAYIRDLATGVQSGPYTTGLAGRVHQTWDPSLSTGGAIALTAPPSGSKKRGGELVRSGVLRAPLGGSRFKLVSNAWRVRFCGARPIAEMMDGRVFELDPVSIKKKRYVTTFPNEAFTWEVLPGCNDNYFYATGSGNRGPIVRAYPLGR
ncbi:MAG: hypothetical protein ACRDKE_12885, partial [Solirubrobacterales bacterium]